MTSEFIYEFMYMKNIVKSYLNSCVPRFQMTVLGMSFRKVSYEDFVCSVFSGNQEKTKPLTRRSVSSKTPRLYNCSNLCPCARPAHVGELRALARVQVFQNSGSQMVVLRFTTLSARDLHWRNPRKKNYRERSNMKSARVSVLTGLVPHKMAKARQNVSALIKNQTQVAWLTATHLTY